MRGSKDFVPGDCSSYPATRNGPIHCSNIWYEWQFLCPYDENKRLEVRMSLDVSLSLLYHVNGAWQENIVGEQRAFELVINLGA